MSRWLGLDITPSAVRLALLQSSYRRTTVEALREERLADHETRAAAIRAAMTGLRADAVASALHGDRCFVRRLSLPATAAKELANVLSFEVESTLPVELDDAVMDHRVLRRNPDTDPEGQLSIFCGVAYAEEVRDHIGVVLRGTSHEPQRVGIGALPLSNLGQVIPEIQRAQVAILDLDDHHADFAVFQHGEPRFMRCMSRGVSGLPGDVNIIASELRQTIGAWRMQGGGPVEGIYVVGSGRATPGLDAFIRAQLDLAVLDLPKPSLDGLTPEMTERLPRFAKAIALALGLSRRASDLNLRQGRLEAQQTFQFLRDKTPLLAGLGAAIFVSFGFSVFAETRALDNEHAILAQQLGNATQAHFGERVEDPKKANELLENAIAGKTGDPMPKMDAFDVMIELSNRIPKDMTHDIADFEYNRGEVKIAGVVPAISDANLVKDKMAEHECFKDVNIARTTQLKNEDKQKYNLEFKVSCASDTKPAAKPKPKAKTDTKGEGK